MKLTIRQLAQFDTDTKVIRDFIAEVETDPLQLSPAEDAAERVRQLAHQLMDIEVKIS